ncbi:MAG TPA: HAD family hydrolase [Candidatus Angelobacter sp.]
MPMRVSGTLPPKALAFDLDGTLLDSFSIHFESYRQTCAHFDITITEEAFRAAYSADWNQTYGALGIQPDHWEAASKLWRSQAAKHQAQLLPGVKDTLLQLRQTHHLALVTSGSKARVTRDLKSTGISQFFQVVVTGEDVQKPKPSPEGLIRVLDHLKLAPQEAVYIGDWFSDREMADAAGVSFVGIRSEFNAAHPDKALFTLNSVAELPALLKLGRRSAAH